MIASTRSTAPSLVLVAGIALLGLACDSGGADSPTAPLGANVAEVEFDSFQLANQARRDGNVQPLLDLDEAVAQVAREHSRAMRDQNFFSHAGPAGGLRARLQAAGISFTAAGENLAKMDSVPDPAGEAHRRFLDSAEHRSVMLDSRFRLAGVGVARSGQTYWLTQIYIRP